MRIALSSLFFTIILSACSNDLVKTGIPQTSFNITESKRLGVFVKEYVPSKNVLDLGDRKITIEEVWVEHYWFYKDQEDNIDIGTSLRGLIRLDPQDNLLDIEISTDANRYKCITGNKLCFRLSEFDKDSIGIVIHGQKDVDVTLAIK